MGEAFFRRDIKRNTALRTFKKYIFENIKLIKLYFDWESTKPYLNIGNIWNI